MTEPVKPAVLMPGMETTMETLAYFQAMGEMPFRDVGWTARWMDFQMVVRDLDRALAEIAKLKREVDYWKILFQNREPEIARLTAALTEARAALRDLHSIDPSAAVAKAREDGEEAVLQFIANGIFLHDDAPPKRFADEVVAAYRSRSTP